MSRMRKQKDRSHRWTTPSNADLDDQGDGEETTRCVFWVAGAEKSAGVVQDVSESCGTAVRCDREAQGGGGTELRTSPEPLLVAMVMNRPTDAVRQEAPSTIMFAYDIMRHNEIYNESREKIWRGGGLPWNTEEGRKEGRARSRDQRKEKKSVGL